MSKWYLHHPKSNQRWVIASKLTLGRVGGNADIQLNDKLLSRKHLSIELVNDRPVIKDLNSTNGTVVGEHKLQNDEYHFAGDRCCFSIGGQEFVVNTNKSPIDPAKESNQLEEEATPIHPLLAIPLLLLAIAIFIFQDAFSLVFIFREELRFLLLATSVFLIILYLKGRYLKVWYMKRVIILTGILTFSLTTAYDEMVLRPDHGIIPLKGRLANPDLLPTSAIIQKLFFQYQNLGPLRIYLEETYTMQSISRLIADISFPVKRFCLESNTDDPPECLWMNLTDLIFSQKMSIYSAHLAWNLSANLEKKNPKTPNFVSAAKNINRFGDLLAWLARPSIIEQKYKLPENYLTDNHSIRPTISNLLKDNNQQTITKTVRKMPSEERKLFMAIIYDVAPSLKLLAKLKASLTEEFQMLETELNRRGKENLNDTETKILVNFFDSFRKDWEEKKQSRPGLLFYLPDTFWEL